MNRRLTLILTSALLAPAALAVAMAAQAQPAAPAGHPGALHMADMKAMHEAMKTQHLEDMKTILRLRPDQEPALAAFMAAHQPKMGMHGLGGMHGGPGMMQGPPKAKTTPERLDDMAKREAAMSAEHDKQRQALAKFYAALSPDQQKVFDAVQRLQHGGHGGPHMKRVVIRGGPGGPGGPMPMPKHDGPH